MTLTKREFGLVLLLAVAVSTAIGFAMAQASNPQSATAASPAQASASNKAIVKELKKITLNTSKTNQSASNIYGKLGNTVTDFTVLGELSEISRGMGSGIGGSNNVLGLLKLICGNTNAASPSGTCY